MTQYQQLLIEIETWLQSTLEILNVELRTETESQIQQNIEQYNILNEELKDKEAKLQELSKICEEFKQYPDLQELATTLVEQLNTVTLGLIEHKTVITEKIAFFHRQLEEMQRSPDASLQNTLSSSSMPMEEIAIHADAKKASEAFIAAEVVPITSVTIETQTGRSLTSPPPVVTTTKDASITCKPPTDVQIQTHFSESEPPTKETITVLKTIKDGQETIQIATKPEPQPIIEEPDDVLVQANYRKVPEGAGNQTAQVSILHATQNQPFETVFVEPDETTTEIIVDADGTKRIIVKKLQRTVVRQQQTLQQQQLTTTKVLSENDVPVSQSFSQVTLEGQQSSTTMARGDGRKEMLTTQSYGGKVVTGAPGSEVTVHEFQSEPESNYTVVEATQPAEVEVQGVKLRQGDVTFVDNQNATLLPADSEIHTSSSSVRAVVQQVTRRVIRRTRRIIRRIVIVDGKEQVTEEIVEEPEEVEFTEEGIPRVSINVTRTEDGKVVHDQQFGEPLEQEGVTVTKKVTSVVVDAEGKPTETQRYVVEQPPAQLETAPPLVTDTAEIISEPNTEITAANVIHEFIQQEGASAHSKVDIAPDIACELLTTIKKVPKDEPVQESVVESTQDAVVTEVIVPPSQELSIEEVDSVPQATEATATEALDITLQQPSQEIDLTKQITLEFIANEQTFRPVTPEISIKVEEEITKTPASEEEKPTSPKDKSKKKRKLKGKKQQVCTPRTQSPAVPPEDEETVEATTPESQPFEDKLEIVATSTETGLEVAKVPEVVSTSQPGEVLPSESKLEEQKSVPFTGKDVEEFLYQEIVSAEAPQASAMEIAQEVKPTETEKAVTLPAAITVEEIKPTEVQETQTSLELEERPPEEEVTTEVVFQETQTSLTPTISVEESQPVFTGVVAQETQTSLTPELEEKSSDRVEIETTGVVVQETQTSLTPEITQIISVEEDKPAVAETFVQEIQTLVASGEDRPEETPDATSGVSIVQDIQTVLTPEDLREVTQTLLIQESQTSLTPVVQESQTSFSPQNESLTVESKEFPRVAPAFAEPIDLTQETQTSFTSEANVTIAQQPIEERFEVAVQETQTSFSPESVVEDNEFIKITEIAPVRQPLESETKVVAAEAIQKEKEQAQPTSIVQFELSLEEKLPEFEVAPKVEVSVSHDETKTEAVLSDIHVTLPCISESKVETIVKTVALTPIDSKTNIEHTEPSSPSDVDRGGRKSKKKKKHKESKTPSEQEETVEEVHIAEEATEEKIVKEQTPQTPETSLAESTDIILSASQISEETPKPTLEVFEPITQTEESEHTDKEEGYEADKTTVDETLPEEGDKKKRKKKKRKQKVKVEESEETQVPQTTTDTETAGESIQFSDEEVAEHRPTVSEAPKKSKKHKKGKKSRDVEPEAEVLEPALQEAQLDEVSSHQDTYKSISTPSEPDTVKVIEEKIITPQSESPQEITTKMVITVPVIEAVITQEAPVQTSPEISEITTEFIKQETIGTEQASVQTTPEVPKEVAETAIQTIEQEVEVQKVAQAEVVETSSQAVVETNENVTQTFIPEMVEVVTSESAIQTATPENVELVEEFAQTVTPEQVEIPKSETAIQTVIVESQEGSVQTITTPEPLQDIQTTEISIQAKPLDVEQSSQTSPIPSAPPLDEITQTSPIQEFQTPPIQTIETIEANSQTQPVVIHEVGEITPPSSSSEQYEVFVETAVTVPGQESIQITTDRSEIPITITSEGIVEQLTSNYENVQVTGDKHSATTALLDSERDHDKEKRHRRKRKHGDEKQEQPQSIEKDLFASFKQQDTPEVEAGRELYAEMARRRSRTPSPTKVIVETSVEPAENVVFVQQHPEQEPSQTPVIVGVKPAESIALVQQHEKQEPMIEEIQSKVEVISDVQDAVQVAQTVEDLTPLQVKEEPKLQQSSEIVPLPESSTVAEVTEESSLVQAIPREQEQSKKEETTDQPTVEESSTTINISITIPPETPSTISETSESTVPPVEFSETPTSVTSELTIDTSEEIVQPPKTKSAGKKSNKRSKSVAIEEVLSPTEIVDTPVTPSADAPLSPPNYSRISYTWDKPSRSEVTETQELLKSERAIEPIPLQEIGIRWNQTQAIERVKNLQNANRTTHLSDVLYLATLHEIITEESIEERNFNVQQNLNAVREAVVKRDVVEIQQTVITTVQTITTWLETIEYRIYLARQQTADGPSKERVQVLSNLKSEISSIESNVAELQSTLDEAGDVYNEEDRNRMRNYIESLQQQVKVIEEVTEENEQLAVADLSRWEEFVIGVSELNKNIGGIKRQLSDLTESDAAPQTKFNDLEKLENANRTNMVKAVALITTAKGLMRDFPGREIPQEIYANQELTKQIEHNIEIERERVLQLLSLADEYEQTLKEFSQIIDIADALVESPILVRNLEHLEEEMQNHRKFFVNLSHCRAILESLEQNLDSETKALHSDMHQNLYERARISLDKATGRFQQMSLAASRWTVLEQGMKEEQRWLQVAQQRVPDLSSVTSADYDQYINLYQSLSLDIAHHHAKLSHLNGIAEKLQELVICSELEETYIESLEIIKKLQEDVQNNLKRLIAFRDMWGSYNLLSDKLEVWLKDAEDELSRIESSEESETPLPGQMRQFWVRVTCAIQHHDHFINMFFFFY